MKKRKLMVRVVAIVLALLIVGSALAVALSALAAPTDMPFIDTGDRSENPLRMPLIIGGAALFLILLCLILPKLLKKK